jgi:hypothetical protein
MAMGLGLMGLVLMGLGLVRLVRLVGLGTERLMEPALLPMRLGQVLY